MATEIKAKIGQEEERPYFGLTLSQTGGIVASIVVGGIMYVLFFFLPFIIKILLSVAACSATLYFALKQFHGMPGHRYIWVSIKYARKPKTYLYKVDRINQLVDDWG